MKIKQLIDEDFINYKKPSMVLAFPNCTFKCDKECGMKVCQNSPLAKAPTIEVDDYKIVDRYMSNPLTSAVVLQGLEPLDDMYQLRAFIKIFRDRTDDDIVIYTGYNIDESLSKILKGWIFKNKLKNIIIKFGRYIPDRSSKYDNVLGVVLASDNQFAIKI